MKRLVLFALLILAAALGACNTQPPADATPESIEVPPPSEDLLRLRANPWQWVALTTSEGETAVAQPERYVVAFGGDGSLTITADCNTVLGEHVPSDGGDLAITPGPATLAACPEGSRGDEFVRLLSGATGYAFDGERLLIALADGGTLAFTVAGE